MNYLQFSGTLTRQAMNKALDSLKVGMTEHDVSKIICHHYNLFGASEAFRTLVSFGSNTTRLHGYPTDRKLERGDIVMIDTGALFNGFATDKTVTIQFDGDDNEIFNEFSNDIYELKNMLEDCVQVGRPSNCIEKKYTSFLDSLGLFQEHYVGHMISGDVVHAGNLTWEHDFSSGDVFTIEPGVYLDDFGIRLEDTYTIINNKLNKLT